MSLNLAVIAYEGAKRLPDKPALVEGERVLRYGELFEVAGRLAAALKAAGVRRGEHVALMFPNVPEFSVAYFGIQLAGCTAVPLNVMLTGEEIAYHLSDSDAAALLVWHELYPPAATGFADSATCRELLVLGGEPGDARGSGLAGPMAQHAPVRELPDTRADDTAVILYTSGTTGRPKGAELTHFNLLYNADHAATRLHGLHQDSVALAVLPLFHSFGQTVIQNGTLMLGGTVVMLPRFEPGAAFETMSRRRVSFFAAVPTMYFALLHHDGAEDFDLKSLETCVSGGAPMPVEVMRAFDQRYGVSIQEGYGLSETSPVASCNVRERPKKPGSIGVPIWGVQFRLRDDDGHWIEQNGVPGEICIKGYNVMKGYYKRPEATAEAITDGWFRTGDIAKRDDDGYYFIVDRKKDMILRGGYNVYPREVEEVLYTHAAVAEAAVIGMPDERLGEQVKAVVALKPGTQAQPDELIAHCREHLAAYKVPQQLELVAALPKGSTGKILKRALRG
jgi:long-chain acyl-CoA synthetase